MQAEVKVIMPKTGGKKDTVRYTTVLPVEHVNELKAMAQKAVIPSVNRGIRMAIEEFIESQNKLRYEQKMREAAKDKDFINRLSETQGDFKVADHEEMSTW
jgi:hypothetical protein